MENLRSFVPSPFVEDDMWRPADEGRSLHDEISMFYREVLQMSTPVGVKDLPDVDVVLKKVSNLLLSEQLVGIQFIHWELIVNSLSTLRKSKETEWPYILFPHSTMGSIFLKACSLAECPTWLQCIVDKSVSSKYSN